MQRVTGISIKKRNYGVLLITLGSLFLATSCFTGMVNTRMSRVYGPSLANVEGAVGNEDVNGKFPESIYIKTATQTFNDTYFFLLSDNRIWYKSIDPSGEIPEWKRFRSTGLPSARFKKDFIKPGAIVSISADANELQAISDTGRIYQYVFDPGLLLQDYFWKDHIGWPEAAPLEINTLVRGFRSWAVAKRNATVLWSEDRFGNQHHYGTMGIENSYFLCANGQEIRYSDTGLPQDFSHTILGPERGRFIAETLSASACTIFEINAAGEMYTRLADFDTLGSDPLFRYTYRAQDYGMPGTAYRSNYTPWGLPAEDWKKEPSIPISGKARLSRFITILQNGHGNAARELRVAGLDSTGKVGFYFKGIAETTWSFREAPLVLSEADFLDRNAVAKGNAPRGKSPEAQYFGSVWKADTPINDITLTIPDFTLNEGASKLVVSRKDESAAFILHSIDGWSYFRRYDPGRDGTPKLMMVTIEVPEGALDGISPEFRAVLSELFVKYDRETFAFVAEATTDYLLIRQSKWAKDDTTLFLSIDPHSVRVNPSVFRRILIGNDELVKEFSSPQLRLEGESLSGQITRETLTSLIARNRDYRMRLVNAIKMYSSYKISSSISGKTYGVFNAISHITLLYLIDFPKIYTVTRHGTPIMRENTRNAATVTDAKFWMYKKFLELVDIRIELYGEYLASIETGRSPPERFATFSEDFMGYFEHTGIPNTLFGVWNGADKPVNCISSSKLFENDLPGLLLVTREAEPKVYLVDFSNLPSDVFRREGLDFASKPLSTAVAISPLVIPGIPIGDFMSGSPSSLPAENRDIIATLDWNGSALTIWTDQSDGSRKILFSSMPELTASKKAD